MPMHDPIDGPGVLPKPRERRRVVGVREILYLHLGAFIPSILIGQCERWGYESILEAEFLGPFFGPAVILISLSTLAFPVAVLATSRAEAPVGGWSWAALPLSLAISSVQFLAMLPLVQ